MLRITKLLLLFIILSIQVIFAQKRQMEYLNRGLIAVKIPSGVYLSWRFLGTDTSTTGFNIYRDDVLINKTPISTSTNYTDVDGKSQSEYKVLPVINGIEDTAGETEVEPWLQPYLTLKLKRPDNGLTPPNKYGSVGKSATASFPKGQPYGYSPNDCSVGDLDGDGQYEIIVKWDPSNSQDNSIYGITGKVYIDAYKLDGTLLWRIDLGKNIRAGAHYTQFLVYDFDGDGISELVCKTAPGTIDGKGNYVIMNSDDPLADYVSYDTTQLSGGKMLGTIQSGPEYLSLFDGKTGAELNTIAYNPPRGVVSEWGDTYANRCDRFLATVAYLDGIHPSAVMCRGYYTRATLAAFDIINKKLVQRWFYDSGRTVGNGAFNQGNHNLSAGDVDNDGKDEIIYGSCAFDDDGTLLYRTGLGHGDAMHLSDIDIDNPGLEVWDVHEDTIVAYGYELHDAKTGKILWGTNLNFDNSRGLAADVDSRYPGLELWSSGEPGIFSSKGEKISTARLSINYRIYWDGDLQDELLDDVKIMKWNGSVISTILTGTGVSSCNGTKYTPNLSADILGDWREEVIFWTPDDSSKIRIYTTTTETQYRLFTLMHDPIYRLGISWQNIGYNQPPHLGFYIGDGLKNVKQPNIEMVKFKPVVTQLAKKEAQKLRIFNSQGTLHILSGNTIQEINVYSVTGQLLLSFPKVNSYTFENILSTNNRLVIVMVKTTDGIQTFKIVN